MIKSNTNNKLLSSSKLDSLINLKNSSTSLINKNKANYEKMNFKYELETPFKDKQIQEAFNTIDIHKNKFLTMEELSLFLDILEIKANDKQIEEMIRMADANLTGKVSFKEFSQMAKGELLSPIGIALPPTALLLESN